MKLPKAYSWLQTESGPRHLLKAVELFGTEEIAGPKHNPVILGWAKETNLDKVYVSDETPWCGLFVATCLKRAGREPVATPLWALSWNKWGVEVKEPMLGDILTFTRNGGGHVGFYVGEDATAYHVLGGNQGDKVSIVRILKSRLSQARRPQYNSIPENIRKIVLTSNGILSTNEA